MMGQAVVEARTGSEITINEDPKDMHLWSLTKGFSNFWVKSHFL